MRLHKEKTPKTKDDRLTVRITTGGGKCPIAIYEEKLFLVGGDNITINLPEQPVVFTRGTYGAVPLRLKYRGTWYEIGAEICDP